MQAELELQIAKVIREVDGANTLGASTLAVYIARALLSQYVLCEKEPVAWMLGNNGLVLARDKPDDRASWRPLYAPASPLGNASLAGNADILPQGKAGKEGGE
jgi:hypothetical protein